MFTPRFFHPGDALEDPFAVREQVFVREQGFSLELEFDATDPVAHHVVLYDGAQAAATGRLFPDPQVPGRYIIGRIAVLAEYRGHRLGAQVMACLEDRARELGASEVSLGAQCQAAGFYRKLGYAPYGEVYLDEHCEHIHMKKQL